MSHAHAHCSCEHTHCSCGHAHAHHDADTPWRSIAVGLCLLLAALVAEHFSLTLLLVVGLYLAAYLVVSHEVLEEAWHSLRHGDVFNEFVLMSLATLGALVLGEWAEACAVMLLYGIGEALQDRAVTRAQDDIESLVHLVPDTAQREGADGSIATVAVADLRGGDVVRLLPGSRVPTDGILLDRAAAFNTAALTGESVPREIAAEGEVLAGMLTVDAAVRVRVTRVSEESAVARIMTMVRTAQERKAPAERFITRFARVYTPIVFAAALLLVLVPVAMAVWAGDGGSSLWSVVRLWAYRALTFLVISCPCAFVLCTPLAYFRALGLASRRGVLFKGAEYLTLLHSVDSLAFDKTGTLTTGRFRVTAADAAALPWAMAVESQSQHPMAQAVVAYGRAQHVAQPTATEVREVAGHGMAAVVEGRRVKVGKQRFAASGTDFAEDGLQHVYVSVDDAYIGRITLSDTLRPEAAAVIADARTLRLHTAVLSGDKAVVTQQVGSAVGVDAAYGALLPEDKVAYVSQMQQRGHRVAFVGDGINDTPVLATAEVGVAMGALGSEAAIETADVVIQTSDLRALPWALRLAHRTHRVVLGVIAFALIVKVAVLVLSAFGEVGMWMAVFADTGVTLTAVLMVMTLLRAPRMAR